LSEEKKKAKAEKVNTLQTEVILIY